MSDTRHLYAVDSNGETTPPSGPTDTGPGDRTRAPQKARPKYPVPTDRLKFEMQEKALRVVCTASRGGQEPVDAEKMAGLLGVAATTAPLNNAFFVDVGLMEKRGKGSYLPTPVALQYQQKWSFDPKAAPAILVPAFAGTWFYEVVRQLLEVGPTTREQAIAALAAEAHTDSSYATQYGFLLDWLEYVGLIGADGGVVVIGSNIPLPDEGAGRTDQGPPVEPPTAKRADHQEPEPAARPAAGTVVLAVDIKFTATAEDIARLSPEQIAMLFEGVGKLHAAKAALGS